MKQISSFSWLVLLDAAILAVAPLLALSLRFDGLVPEGFWQPVLACLPAAVALQLAVFYGFGIYRRLWQFAGFDELAALVGAVAVSEGLLLAWALALDIVEPRSAYLVQALLVAAGVGASRLAVRVRYQRHQQSGRKLRRVLIIGAGRLGVALVKEVRAYAGSARRVVGFLHDDAACWGKILNGVPVLGGRGLLPELVRQNQVDEIIIATACCDKAWLRSNLRLCREAKCAVKIIPSFREMLSGEVSLRKLREINLEDLLGRASSPLDTEALRGCLEGRTVLVTGAGGSIGSEICRQVAKLAPRRMILLGKSENNIYEIEQELRWSYPALPLEAVIADIRNARRIGEVFERYRPQVVLHAAAHKHVPLMEAQPVEAVTVNIFGTRTVATAALRSGVERFVMVSTDKAINPTSVMGATKRAAEMLICNLNGKGKTKFSAVRFGNVLGSRGSVVPLFRKQIFKGGPITVTHPEMKRYFMTISEAAQLVLQAGASARGGEVFVLDMGQPIKIVDLACALIELSGLRPHEDIKIEYSGLRPGEKLYEELLYDDEGHTATKHEKIFQARLQPEDEAKIEALLQRLQTEEDGESIRELLVELVPTYARPQAEASLQTTG